MTEPDVVDAAGFEALYRATASQVRRYAERQIGTDLAEDVVIETFTTVWSRRDVLPRAADEQRAWVFGVARLTLKAAARRARRAGSVVPEQAHEASGTAADHADLVVGRDRVDRLLAALPPREREAMELAVWAGLTPTQAAQVLGCSVTALTTRLARARRRLDALLGAEASAEQGVGRVR